MGYYLDDGYTGTNDDRPEFQRLLELTRQGQIQCIIVKDLSRFARNYIITGDYLEQIFPVLGVRFIAVTDHYDSANSTTVEDNMSMVLKSVLNAYYSKDLSRKIQASVHQRMRQGTYLPPPPFGYLVNEDRTNYVIDPPAAVTIQRMFALALEGKTRMEIANALNAEGFVTPAVYNRNNSRTRKGSLLLVSDHPCWEPNQLKRTRQLKLDAYEAYASERLSLKDYQDKKNQLTEQAKELERRLAVLGEQESAMNNGIIPHDVQAVADAAHTYQHVHSLTREMVEAFVESVYLYDETHYEIVWKYKDAWAQLTGQTEKGAQSNE